MEFYLAIAIGWLYACGIFLILRRSILRLIIGLVVLTTAANLLIFTVANVNRGTPAIIAPGRNFPQVGYADPLPQALILTAIVIGFGTMAFTFVLTYRLYKTLNTDDLDAIKLQSTQR